MTNNLLKSCVWLYDNLTNIEIYEYEINFNSYLGIRIIYKFKLKIFLTENPRTEGLFR